VPAYLLSEDVQKLLGVSDRTLKSFVARRAIPHRRLPGVRRTLFVEQEIAEWVDGAELEVVETPAGGRVVKPRAET